MSGSNVRGVAVAVKGMNRSNFVQESKVMAPLMLMSMSPGIAASAIAKCDIRARNVCV